MKILVFGHWLEVGGTQVNAIDISSTLRDVHGHEVTYFATPGPMLKLIEQRCLRFIPAPPARLHPSIGRMRGLTQVLQRESFDVLHVWDWWQCLDAYYVAQLLDRVPMVVTDMSMSLYDLHPKAVPITFGTPELVDEARAKGRHSASLMLPPVDLKANSRGAVNGNAFRLEQGIGRDEVLIVIVSRLTKWMKGDGVQRAIGAVRALGRKYPLRLVIAGDGNARATLERFARETNAALGRCAVSLIGRVLDPRPLYAAADIVIGMGGSALRGMAFGKPVIVVGDSGFSAPLTPKTRDYFYYHGIYGVGDGDPDNSCLTEHVRKLAASRDERLSLSECSLEFVQQHFDLLKVTGKLEQTLRSAAAAPWRADMAVFDGLRTAAVWVKERRFIPVG